MGSPARGPTTPVRVRVLGGTGPRERPDRLVTEEPMEIRLQVPGRPAEPLAVTMRTPGHDFELAVGFCWSEGFLARVDDLERAAYCVAGDGTQEFNVVTVMARAPAGRDATARRVQGTSACGVCGTATLADLEVACDPVTAPLTVTHAVLRDLPARLRAAQAVFDATGGLHAAALFSAAGDLELVREDVGRHNAVDKLVGRCVLDRSLPRADRILMVSGRLGFEIVQKAARLGVPVIGAVSAPSSLAVAAARRLGVTVVGFIREERANVYTHPERIEAAA